MTWYARSSVGLARAKTFGRYELLLELGHGGMAELYLARLVGVGGFTRLVAIKRILPHLARDKQFVELFLNEGRIAAQLAHPNVCQVYELAETDGELYLAMEYLDGVSWDELLASIPPTEPIRLPLTAGALAQIAEGLHYGHQLRDAHGQPTPVIHRDVSPQNLFVTVDGVCKVLDFGVAKMTASGPRTRTGVLKGKIPYMSPEQIRGEPLDPRADVFALGVVAWEALTGERLFDRESDFLVWKAIDEEPIPTVTSRRPELPPAIDAVIARALERDRDRRYASTRELAAALSAIAPSSFGAPQIANVVRSACAARLAGRAAMLAEVAHEPSPADTIEDAAATASLRVRNRSVTITRPRRRRWPWLAAGAAIVAIAAIAVAVGRSGDASLPEQPSAREPPARDPLGVAIDTLGDLDRMRGADSKRPAIERLRRLAPAIEAMQRRAEGLAVAPGRYSVRSQPEATVFVDGTRFGTTPIAQRTLAAGHHQVRVELVDGRERTFEIDVEPGGDVDSGTLAW